MATSYTSLLGLALPATGELSGTWGDTVNNYISTYVDSAVAGSLTVTADTTLTKTTGSSLGATSSQYAIIIASPASANITITAPAASKSYIINNTSGTYTVKIVGAGPTTGVTLAVNEKAIVAWNGSDFVKIASSVVATGTVTSVGLSAPSIFTVTNSPVTSSGTLTLSYSGTALPIANGGTGSTSTTFVNLASNVTGTLPIANGGTGSTSTTFVNLASNVTGTLPIANGGTGSTSTTFVSLTTNVTGTLPVGNGGTGATTLAGANIPVTNVANTFSATQTFSGTSSTFGTSLLDSNETVNVVAAAPSATTNFYVQSGSVQYYTSNAANNWTLNIAFSSGTSLNSALAVGQSVTFSLVTTQSTTAYYNSAVTIDNTSVTPKWVGGAPTAGNASGLDVYRFAVIKTASATYTVLASLTQYK
jgi:hypothetical protein